MNKYDIMNDVVPPLTADQMATRGYAKGGRIGEYFIREPVKKVGRFLKDNVPPVFSKFAEYLPKITGKVEKYSAQLNPETKKWDIGTISGDKKIKVEGKFVKNPDYFKATETGFENQAVANKQIKRLQKQQVATVTKADKTEGALVWKSRESIADAPFQIATKKQWLDYLLNRGVGYKELSDTSLFLTKAGKHTEDMVPPSKKVKIPQYEIVEEFNEALGKTIQRRTNKITGYKDAIEEQPLFGNLKVTKPGDNIRIPEGGFLNIDSNARISKADFLKEFDGIVPKIKVHLLGTRNFSDGLKYILDSTTPSSKKTAEKGMSGRIVYREDDDSIKYYKDYPRANFDAKFEGLLKQVQTLVNRLKEAGPNVNIKQEEGTEAFDEKMVENVVERINAAFKGQYGVDDVIGRGVNQLNHPNLPFEVVKLGNSLADVFSKRGVQYNVRGQPRHTGDQILEGGYNQNELFFSFEPGKMRTGEVGEFKPGHDFNLGEDAKGGFVHTRISDRIDEAGRKILFIEEIQSDMHQAVQNRGADYKPRSDRETTSSVATELKNLKDLNKTLVEEMKQNTKTLEKVMASETRGQTPLGLQIRQSKIEELQALRSSQLKENKQQKAAIEELQKRLKVGTIPEGPFKNSKDYGKFVLKYLLKMARENGYDGVGMSNAWIKTRNPSEVAPGGKVYEGHFGFYGNWGLPDPSVPASFKDSIMKDAFGEVARDSKTKLALTAIKDHEIGKTWGDIPVLLLTKGRNKEIIKEAAERIDKGQSAYYKGGLIREIFKDVVPTL